MIHSQSRIKERTKELLDTYKNGLNKEFKTLQKVQSLFSTHSIKLIKYSETQINKISNRKELLSQKDLQRINKNKAKSPNPSSSIFPLNKLHYYRKYINRDSGILPRGHS
jgi:ribosomal protein S17E